MPDTPAAPAARAPKAPYRAKAYQLTPEQVQQILKDANRSGWDTPGWVTEETQLKGPDVYGDTEEVPTGKFTLAVRGPGGTNDTIPLRQGEPTIPGGVPGKPQESWIVTDPTPVPPKVPGSERGPDTLQDKWGGQYEKDKTTGQWTAVITGDQSAYQAGAVTTAKSQAEYDEMQSNQDAGRGFMSTGDYQTLRLAYDKHQLSKDEFEQKKKEFTDTNKIAQQAEKRLGTTAEATNKYTGAQTTNLGVETEVNQEKLRQLIASAPTTAEAARLTNELTKLQQQKTKQDLNKPTSFDLGTQQTYGVATPEGGIEERFRQGYVPKTLGEVAARRGQLLQLGQAKRDEVMNKVKTSNGAYTEDQAHTEFNDWYDRNIDPQIGALQAAEEEAQVARGKDQASMRQQAITAAQGAGSQQISAYNAQNPNIVSPGYAEEMGKLWNATAQGKRAGPVDYTKLVRQEDDLGQGAARATAEALKYIDPNAAQMTGAPPPPDYTALNPAQVLDRTKLFYGQNGPQTVPAPGAEAAPPGAPAAAPDWQRADQAQGVAPPGNAQQAPGAPPAGSVLPGSPQYLGNAPAPAAPAAAPYDWSAAANVTTDLQALLKKMRENNVYAYGGAS